MTSISRILCVVDPTQKAQPALIRASWLARSTGSALELFICCYNEYLSGERLFDSPSLRRAREEYVARYKRRLEKFAEPLREEGLEVFTTSVWDHPLADGIVRQAIESRADVVFKDTHYHSALSRMLFTNTDWRLMRTCPASLWLVTPRDIADSPKIIAAIDPMHSHDKPASLDTRILNMGKSVAEAGSGQLHAFHAYDPRMIISANMSSAYLPVSMPIDDIEADMRKQHSKRFFEVTKDFDLSQDNKHLQSGSVQEQLPDLIEELDADLVVMGAVARSTTKRMFIGATAEKTLGTIPCDLLIIKPDWFETPVEITRRDAA